MSAHRQTDKGEVNAVKVVTTVSREGCTWQKWNYKWMFCLVLVGTVLGASLHLWAQDSSIAARMQEVLKRFVRETGYQVIGVGSWITGTGYQPGGSDHDMRLLLPRGTSPQEAQRAWATAQQRLREMIKQEFGEQA
ncbi:MAG: hypothetical protein RUDDFDWM_002063, partial [Candidatus Fervidibacterota bacterium]